MKNTNKTPLLLNKKEINKFDRLYSSKRQQGYKIDFDSTEMNFLYKKQKNTVNH